jgi:hypothetical protein
MLQKNGRNNCRQREFIVDVRQNPLNSSEGGLYIGASKDLSVGTLFSGFVDDVRIYNQALTAEEIAALVQ